MTGEPCSACKPGRTGVYPDVDAPLARWEYDWQPEPGESGGAALYPLPRTADLVVTRGAIRALFAGRYSACSRMKNC